MLSHLSNRHTLATILRFHTGGGGGGGGGAIKSVLMQRSHEAATTSSSPRTGVFRLRATAVSPTSSSSVLNRRRASEPASGPGSGHFLPLPWTLPPRTFPPPRFGHHGHFRPPSLYSSTCILTTRARYIFPEKKIKCASFKQC